MNENLEEHIAHLHLIKTTDPENEKPVYRREGFDGISTFEELDAKLGEELRELRHKKNLTRADVGILVGLSEQVYGRYERSASRMQVSRLVHLSEILGVSPINMLYATAPHLWGKSREEADNKFRIMKLIEDLPPETMGSIVTLLEAVAVLQDNAGSTNEAG
jgi:transcriptional regulator with XRE-family HTH domain